MGIPNGVKLDKGDLDEDDRGIVVTGYVTPESLTQLKVDSYQREELSQAKISSLMEAHRNSRVPTVELGMRGNEDSVVMLEDGKFILTAPTYIVDGFQRITAAVRLLELEPGSDPKIQANIHLNTDFDWERKRFEVLNLGQTMVSGNVTLRNLRHDYDVMEMLLKLSDSPKFILGSRVGWGQAMKRNELISGLTFARSVGLLHSHMGPGKSSSTKEVARGLQKIMENSGKMNMRQNVTTFYDTVDSCFGIKEVAYKNSAVHLKGGFLFALAKMFSDHSNFWVASKLDIDSATILKLRQFPIHDPAVVAYSGQKGIATDLLSHLLAEHVNKGRRTKRLARRDHVEEINFESDSGEDIDD